MRPSSRPSTRVLLPLLRTQLRKNCNHPDLITGPANKELFFPPPDELVRQCGKMQLLERLLDKLHAKGHKVLIFSQVRVG